MLSITRWIPTVAPLRLPLRLAGGCLLGLGLGLALCAVQPVRAAHPDGVAPARLIRFAAEDWPPFIGPDLPAGGLSGALLQAVYERLGYQLQIEYFPWKRTMEFGLHNPRYAGFLAVWRTAEREQLCHFSSSIGSTQTVLAYAKSAPVAAAGLAGLKGVRIGTVAGYANGEQFDALRQRGELEVDEGVNDETNLRKLLKRRVGAIVIEKHVLQHLLASRRFSRSEAADIASIDSMFKERSVHICFKRNELGLAQQKAFNEAAREFDLGKIEKAYWKDNAKRVMAP
ncbi:substrate-binding periplasmic protein [Rugamonas sp. CCM 8940]|uniref:substrate-binding periplasmic protein n=1 Tax=Rugamonas sp. CCM 8940 TaxID=2765359 RepID=UPI0018F29343|nr:transporter substrate-binding domain-containing protein [Rugamonas sp. CCM 8940]MBJ7309671.1 transporter substrate-binding domain-containing protein [Rugamonas sp. CCM 8940]